MEGRAIREVLVVGGGVVGWSAAAALKRRAPFLAVTINPVPPPPDALADRVPATLPSIRGFHGDLRIGEEDAVLATGSGYRLGSRFAGWSKDRADYVHAYGRHGQAFASTAFHLQWLRAAREGATAPFDSFSPAAALAGDGRFAPPAPDAGALFSGYEYGLHLDVERYRAMLRAFALHVGVREESRPIAGTRLRADGFIEALALGDGGEQRADLFVDATGPGATLRAALDDRRDDWRRWLPCDRVLFAHGPAPADPPPLDRVTALGAGWRWSASSPARTSHGLAYPTAQVTDAKAARQLRVATGIEPGEAPVAVAAGTRPKPWLRNCVAIGDAATVMEPLEWCNLHLAHSAIDRLVAMLPDRDCAAVEIADYNRQTLAEAERVRDFLALHYLAASRDEPFWREQRRVEPPASLAHTLALFRERGRLPFYEEETFARDSWLAVLIGQGVFPARVDPLVGATPIGEVRLAMAAMRAAIAAALPSVPTHAAFLSAQLRQPTR